MEIQNLEKKLDIIIKDFQENEKTIKRQSNIENECIKHIDNVISNSIKVEENNIVKKCFNFLYASRPSKENSIKIIKKHQVYLIKLIEIKSYKNGLDGFQTQFDFYESLINETKMVISDSFNYKMMDGIMFLDASSNPFDELFVNLVVVFHIMFLQCLLHYLSQNLKALINKNSFIFDLTVFEKVSRFFLHKHHFFKWLFHSFNVFSENRVKYTNSCVKIIKGYIQLLNIVETYLDKFNIKVYKSCFILKLIEFTGNFSLKNDLFVSSQMLIYLNDLKSMNNSNFLSFIQEIEKSTEVIVLNFLDHLKKNDEEFCKLKTFENLNFSPSVIINNSQIIKKICSKNFKYEQISFLFIDKMLNFFEKKLSQIKKLTKNENFFFDKSTFFFKEILNHTTNYNQIVFCVERFHNVLIKFDEFKKIRNLSNILYMIGLKTNNFGYWELSIDYEKNVYSSLSTSESLIILQTKIKKIVDSLNNLEMYKNTVSILINFLKFLDPNNKTINEFADFISEFENPILIKIIGNCILKQHHFFTNHFFGINEISDFFKLALVLKLFVFFDNLANIENKDLLVQDFLNSLKLNDEKLKVVLYYNYYNSKQLKTFYNFEMTLSDNYLFLTAINLQKLIFFQFDDFLFNQMIVFFENWILNYDKNFEIFEVEIIKSLIRYLKFNGHFGLSAYFILKYKNLNFENHEFKLFLVSELCQAVLWMSLYNEIYEHLNDLRKLLYDSKSFNYFDHINYNLLQYDYFVSINKLDLAKEVFDKLLISFKSNDIFNFENKNILLEKKFKSQILVVKFQIITSKFNILLSNFVDSFFNIKTSIKILFTIIKSFNKKNFKSNYNEIKWEVTILLFDSYKTIIKVSKHLGITKDFLFFLSEFKKLNENNKIPLINCINYYNLIIYNLFLFKKNECENYILQINDLFRFETLKKNLSIKHYKFIVSKFLNERQDSFILPEFTSLNKIPKSDLINIYTLDQHLNIESEFLFSFYSKSFYSTITLNLNNHHYTFLKTILSIKSDFHKICNSIDSSDKFQDFDICVKSFPSISDDGLTDKQFIDVDLINKLIQIKELLISNLNFKIISHLTIYEIRDFFKLTINTLLIISSMTFSKKNVQLLSNLFFLHDLISFRSFQNLKILNQESQKTSNFFPKEITIKNDNRNFEDFSTKFCNDLNEILPNDWMIVSIDFCNYSGDLLLTNFKKNKNPFFLRLSTNRFYKKKLIDHKITFQQMVKHFDDIIEQSNNSTKFSTTSNIITKEDRKSWWKLRFKLNGKLKNLLDYVNNYWIGGFNGIFNNFVEDSLFLHFKTELTKILIKCLPYRKKSPDSNFMNFDNNLFIILYNLSNFNFLQIVDITHFLITSLKFHGEPNTLTELDFTKLQCLVEKLYNEILEVRSLPSFNHLILIPDEKTNFFPWESLECLKNKSITRFPSVNLLIDFLKLKKLEINKSKLYYLINPEGDLIKTEKVFKDKFELLEGSNGLIGVSPKEDQILYNLIEKKLFIYLGHGGCDQYINTATLFKKCLNDGLSLPPSLLIGCSSGYLQNNGILESNGNVYNWLLCGASMILVNLWNVTDKDIDTFSLSVFEKWGLFNKENKESVQNISLAVNSSRDCCILNFLNGAAPIVYGLPLFLATKS